MCVADFKDLDSYLRSCPKRIDLLTFWIPLKPRFFQEPGSPW